MKKTILAAACFFGMTAVGLGAFGAHGLEKIVDANAVQTFETGVRYQMYHAFFLFFLALIPDTLVKSKKAIYVCTLIGILLFSFSIYVLSFNDVIAFNLGAFGIVTPIGGLFLIVAWALLLFHILKSKR